MAIHRHHARSGVAVSVRELTKRYGPAALVLDRIEFAVAPGEIVALVGANGAGKSTLLRCLVRLIEPSAGQIAVGGKNVMTLQPAELRRLRSQVGFVFQRFHLVPRLTAFHNVLLGALGRRGVRAWWPITAPEADRREAYTCLERMRLGALAGARADTLSGGQQQRVAIARMLMQRPSLVLADEPVASLDPAAGVAVMELLREVAIERGLTVIVAMHHLELARRFSDRVIGLQDGRVRIDAASHSWPTADIAALYTLTA